nr:hypothetical protein [Tanacetum cinerariifolium]
MSYTAGNQTNGNAITKANIDARQAGKKIVPGPQYVLLPLLTSNSQGPKSSEDEVVDDAKIKNPGRERAQMNESRNVFGQDKDVNGNRIFTHVSAAGSTYDTADTGIFSSAYGDEVEGAEADFNNLELTIVMDVKSNFLYGTIEEEVYVCQPPGFEDPYFPNKDKGDILLMHKKFYMSYMGELTFFLGLQVIQRDDGIFINQDKYVANILKKFDFSSVKEASTPIETNKALLKDEEAGDVDVHLYRSMIRSLRYLTASRPDIMFAVYACARFQVNPKVSHLDAVKRIFRYLKGQPKLSLCYPKDSPFNLAAFLDSDYAGASLDRKSTTGGCQFFWKETDFMAIGGVSIASRMISTAKESVSTAGASMPASTPGMIDKEEMSKYSEIDQANMLVDLINQRKRYFAEQKAEAKRKRPMTQAQQRTSINNFVPIESEYDKAVPKLAEARSSKRDAEEELDQGRSKQQKIGESS